MKDETCPDETAVVAALRSNRLTGDLRVHAVSCPVCSETVGLAAALQRLASKTPVGIPASFRILWLRAQFARRQERLSYLDLFMLIGSFAIVVTGFIGIVLWKWSVVQGWYTNTSGEAGSNLSIYIFAGCAALVWFLTEEMFLQEK